MDVCAGRSSLWRYSTASRMVRLLARPSRRPSARSSQEFPWNLQADAYAGFHPLYEGGRIVEAACWAHARRKFHDIFAATQSPTASEAIRRIGELYAIEKEVRGSPPEIRLAIRQAKARPVIEDLRAWFDATLQTSRPRATWPDRSAMRSRDGPRSPAISTMEQSRSTTTPPTARCESSR